MFPFAFSHKEGLCPKDLLLARTCNIPVRLPGGTCPLLGSCFCGGGSEYLTTSPSPVKTMHKSKFETHAVTHLGCLLVWHPGWQGKLTVSAWQWGPRPSSKVLSLCLDLKVIWSSFIRSRKGWTIQRLCPPPHPPHSHSEGGYWELQKLKLMRFPLALCLWECFYLSRNDWALMSFS